MAKDKKAEAKAAEAAAAPAPAAEAKPAPKPADPRLKVYKKFTGRFLPKGPLRDRLKIIQERWNADEAHTGVTIEELRALLADWRASRENPKKKAAAQA